MDDYNFNNQNGSDSDGKVNLEKPQNNNVNLNADLNSSSNQNPVQTTDVYSQNNGNMGYNSNFGQPYRNENNALSIISLVLGILSIIGCCCNTSFAFLPLNVPVAIVGIVLGIMSNKKGKNGLAIGGIVTSIIGAVYGLICLIIWVLAFIGLYDLS